MLPIVTKVLTLFGEVIGGQVVAFLKEEFKELKKDFIQYQELKKEFKEIDQKRLELQEDIKLAQTQEERDALLDKMDKLFRKSTGFK